MEQEIVYLLLQGRLPMRAVDTVLLPPHLKPLLQAIEFAMQQGDPFPLKPVHVWKIAQAQFHAQPPARDFLKALDNLQTTTGVLESVCHNLVLRKASSLITDQLSTGQVDLESIKKLLNVVADRTEHTFKICDIVEAQEEYLSKTNIFAIDEVIGGLNAEFCVVAARPKAGKSNFFFNLIHRNAEKRITYVTVADYGKSDVVKNLKDIDRAIVQRTNLTIVDFNGFSATVNDVESAIADTKPDIAIVDRSEKLTPLRRRKDQRMEFADIGDALRRIAKKYICPVWTDAQLSATHEKEAGRPDVSYGRMAEDKTQRAAILDLYFGLHRGKTCTWMTIQGRRKGLPQEIEIQTDTDGRYLC